MKRACSVCAKTVVSDEGAATFQGELVHGACYPTVKAKRDAQARAATEAAAASRRGDLQGLLRRLFRRPVR